MAIVRFFSWFAVFGLLGSCAAANPALTPEPNDQQPIIRIGHGAPLSGTIAHLGVDSQRGAQLAVDEINAAGLTLNGKALRLELVSVDDGANPRTAQATAQKLVNDGVVSVIGHLNSGVSIPASKIYEKAGIPSITPSATNPWLTRQKFRTTFRAIADDERAPQLLARFAVAQRGFKRIAVVDDRSAYGKTVAEAFSAGLIQAGASVVAHEFTDDRGSNLSVVLKALAQHQPDAIFFGGMDAAAGAMLRQMREMGLGAALIGNDGICSGSLPRLAGGALEPGAVFCAESGDFNPDRSEARRQFESNFRTRFNADAQLYAPFSYDIVHLLVNAMKQAKSTLPKDIADTLRVAPPHQGLTDMISFDAKGDLKDGTVTVYTYKASERVFHTLLR